MNDSVKLIVELISFSGCCWLFFGLYISIRIQRFIIKRYEEETDLLKSVYFKEHATFSHKLPDLFASALYASHLITFLWGWGYFRKKKAYRDIENARSVIKHFSSQELRWVKWFTSIGIILIIHGIFFLCVRTIFPELLK